MLVSQIIAQGVKAFETKSYLQALKLFEQAEQAEPGNTSIGLWLAKTHHALGHRAAAIEVLQRLTIPSNDQALEAEATALMKALMSSNGHANSAPVQPTFVLSTLEQFPQPDQSQQNSDSFKMVNRSQVAPSLGRRWSALSLGIKGTLAAIVLGTLPVLSIGGVAYWQANQSITQQIETGEVTRAKSMSDKINRFLFERYGDIQVLANLPILRNSKVKAAIPQASRQRELNRYAEIYGSYSSIVMIDLDGKASLQTNSEALNQNYSDQSYFQEALKTGRPVVSAPTRAKSGETVIYFAAPVKDAETFQLIGVVRTEVPAKYIDDIIQEFGADKREYHLIDKSGKFFLAAEKNQIGRDAQADFPGLNQLVLQKKAGNAILTDKIDGARQVVAYAPLEALEGVPDLGWSSLMATDTAIAFAPQRALLTTLATGTGVVALLVGALAAYLVNRATRPILAASEAVKKLGSGDLTTRLAVTGEDELAVLGANINHMADEIQSLLDQAQQQAEQRKADQEKLQTQVDAIANAVTDIAAGKLDTRIPRLEQEAGPVQDLAENINQMTGQIQELVQAQGQLADERKAQADNMTQQVLQLLTEVKGAAKGDLTVKARVNEGEMGAVADSFNYLVNSLRRIVTNIKDTAGQVINTTGSSIEQTTDLAQQAQAQALQVEETLKQIEQVVGSIDEVAQAAQKAEAVVHKATQTAQAGDEAVDRTVEGINQLRVTIGEAAKMMKRLGEGSQQIGQIVTLISQIASKTDLLALNATIEAARAGEQGQGFAVVADEVRKLAERSAGATKEIAELVDGIQTETSRMIAAMDAGTEEVVRGTKLAATAKLNLQEIMEVSSEISELVQNITRSTQSQTQVAAAISTAVQQTRAESTQTAHRATEVSTSLDELNAVVEQLQSSVQSFRTA
jgi:methyl-accepting chemotaxis protein PixJ